MDTHCTTKRQEEPMTIPDSKRQRTSSHSSNEGKHLNALFTCTLLINSIGFLLRHKKIEMTTQSSDIDMDDAEQSKCGEDLEKGIIGTLNSPKVRKLYFIQSFMLCALTIIAN
jgi:hypothetical protein